MTQVKDILDKKDASALLEKMGFTGAGSALRELTSLSKTPFKAQLDGIAKDALSSPSPEDALNGVAAVAESLSEKTIEDFLLDKENLPRLITLCAGSPYLARLLANKPEWFNWLFLEGGLREIKDQAALGEELRSWCSASVTFEEVSSIIRSFRNKEYLRLGLQDLLHLASMAEVTAGLSDLAGACLDVAHDFCLTELIAKHGRPVYKDDSGRELSAEFSVIALGKLGGRELNFCSDIDLLYIYTTEKGHSQGVKDNKRSAVDLHTFFQKLAQQITKMISAVTEHGFAFRVDLDLRPEGRSGELVNSLRSAEIYYESWGRTWERSAMIKARPVAGSLRLGDEFLKMIEPFVHRRSMDFTALEEIKVMKERIDISLLRRNPDSIDVKLGEGGIREIEFFCQALQLIYGGKDKDLRESSTLKAIEKLRNKKLLTHKQAKTLTNGYIFLRDLEHRIQIVEGKQSQAIPLLSKEVERLARMMGFKATEGGTAAELFQKGYKSITSEVYAIYRTLFYGAQDELQKDIPRDIFLLFSTIEIKEKGLPEDIVAALKGLGFCPDAQTVKKIKLLRDGPDYLKISSATRALREKLAPFLIARAACSPDPDMALINTERFLSTLGARKSLYALLAENPKLTALLIRVFGSSLYLANSLIERPETLEILLSPELSKPVKEDFFEELSSLLSSSDEYEEKLDLIRRYKNQEFFRIGFNDLQERLSCKEVSEQISRLAEAVLQNALAMAEAELKKKYGNPSTPGFFIIGMGKLGGREMIYGSDLDIFFIYADTDKKSSAETTGPKIITDHEFFVRLAQRIISIISVKTSEGAAFEVDTRLRPSGSSGPLTISSTALLNYHRDKAEPWERQAALKARVVAGNMEEGERIIKTLEEITAKRGLCGDEARELLKIRARMEKETANESDGAINIKVGSGGIVDIEFLAQALLLRYGPKKPDKSCLPSTTETLAALLDKNIINSEQYQLLTEAHEFYKKVETRLRIMQDNSDCMLYYQGADKHISEDKVEATASLARRCGYSGKDAGARIVSDFKEKARQIRRLYLEIMEGLS